MKSKKIRKFLWYIVIIFIVVVISIPFVLNLFINKEELKKFQNKKRFDSFVLNIKLCLASNQNNYGIDYNWLIDNCDNIDNIVCEYVNYDNNNLSLRNCVINNQLFSYDEKY